MTGAHVEDWNVPAPPYDYNPSSWRQRIPICILATIGGLIATYMALYQWRLTAGVWDPVFHDQTRQVLDSETSEQMRYWMLIPDAALGAFGYFSEAILGLAGSTRRWQYRPWMVILFGVDVIPLGLVSVVLVILQGTVVGAWCFLCLITAGISVLLVYCAYDEVWSSITYLHRVWRRSRSMSVVWSTFWGRASRAAAKSALVAESR
jgi:uncharacterized membrane protein